MLIYPVLMLALPIYLNWTSFDSKLALVAYRVGLLAIYLAITGVCLGLFVLVRQPPVTHHPPRPHRSACLVSPSLPGCLCVAVHPPARVRGAGRQQGRRGGGGRASRDGSGGYHDMSAQSRVCVCARHMALT